VLSGIKLEDCQENHMAHELCLAREMTSLKMISFACFECDMPSEPTIHETGVDLTIVGDEELFHGEP
jgi:hypothetical protein